RYRRGSITVLVRPALEQRACECYAVVKGELNRLLRLPGRAAAPQLSAFIDQNMEQIVVEWEAFARTLLPAAATMSSLALRDHAKEILTAIAREIESAGGGAPPDAPKAAAQTAAAAHGVR